MSSDQLNLGLETREWNQNERLQFPGRSPETAQLQQAGVRDPERVLLLAPVQPVPERGGQGGAGAQVRHHRVPGTAVTVPLPAASWTRAASAATSASERSTCSTTTSTRTSPTPTRARSWRPSWRAAAASPCRRYRRPRTARRPQGCEHWDPLVAILLYTRWASTVAVFIKIVFLHWIVANKLEASFD